jgi:transposase-like protein
MHRKEFTPDQKAKIVIELLEGATTASEIASRAGVTVRTIQNWRDEFLANAGRAFTVTVDEREARAKRLESDEREKRLAETVGRLTVELEWLKKKAEELDSARVSRGGKRRP